MISKFAGHRTAGLLAMTGVMAWVVAGCAALPAQEMSDARQAVEAAVQSGGEQKSPQQMQQAHAALAQAETALKKYQYKQARQLAQEARRQAIAAQRAAAP